MLVMALTRLLQQVQARVFHTIPFGALSNLSLLDICAGIFVSGVFMLYFGECAGRECVWGGSTLLWQRRGLTACLRGVLTPMLWCLWCLEVGGPCIGSVVARKASLLPSALPSLLPLFPPTPPSPDCCTYPPLCILSFWCTSVTCSGHPVHTSAL